MGEDVYRYFDEPDSVLGEMELKGEEIVKIAAEETDLSAIEPLEISPAGDCDLKKLKQLYGKKLALKR